MYVVIIEKVGGLKGDLIATLKLNLIFLNSLVRVQNLRSIYMMPEAYFGLSLGRRVTHGLK